MVAIEIPFEDNDDTCTVDWKGLTSSRVSKETGNSFQKSTASQGPKIARPDKFRNFGDEDDEDDEDVDVHTSSSPLKKETRKRGLFDDIISKWSYLSEQTAVTENSAMAEDGEAGSEEDSDYYDDEDDMIDDSELKVIFHSEIAIKYTLAIL